MILPKKILQEAGLVAGSKVKIETKKRNGHVVILDPIKKESLAEKYAHYQETPESYSYPDDLESWKSAKVVKVMHQLLYADTQDQHIADIFRRNLGKHQILLVQSYKYRLFSLNYSPK